MTSVNEENNKAMLIDVTMVNGLVTASSELLMLGCRLRNIVVDDITNAPFDEPVFLSCVFEDVTFTSGIHKGLTGPLTSVDCFFDWDAGDSVYDKTGFGRWECTKSGTPGEWERKE